jgi:NADH:ubiquinone oxidoreductase subunit
MCDFCPLDRGRDGRHSAPQRDFPCMASLMFLTRFFTWWNGATFGALYDIGRRGAFVGADDQGNRYFEERKISLDGRKRRYVLYEGLAEPSKVPPDWHGWLHHVFEEPPTVAPLPRRAWEAPHVPNLTGTPGAYRPKGSLARGGDRAKATGDYEAWTPE